MLVEVAVNHDARSSTAGLNTVATLYFHTRLRYTVQIAKNSKFLCKTKHVRLVSVSTQALKLSSNVATGMNEKYWYLKKCPIFAQLSNEQVEAVEKESFFREFRRGEMVYLPNDMADSVMLLARGRVRLFHMTGEGKQAILGFVEPGELFGELSVFSGREREEHAEALETTAVVLVPGRVMQQVIAKSPEVSMKMTQLFGLRLRRVERRLKSLLFRSSRERLIHLLLELAERYGRATQEGVLISQKISHQDMASIIGATRETVTITLGELQDEGVIEVNRRRITLRNVGNLATTIDFGAFVPAGLT